MTQAPLHDGQRIAAIDGLRACAMTMVIAQHCALLPCGWIGVWLFYVISGYVITRGFLDDDASLPRGERWRAFLWRRALRIVPVYLLYLGVNALILGAIGGTQRLAELPSLLSFTFNWRMTFAPDGAAWGPFGHLWTLSVEQQFYLLFPLLVLCVPRRAQTAVTLVLVAAGPLLRWGWGQALAQQPGAEAGELAFAVYAATHCHFDAFLLGSLLARGQGRLQAEPRWGSRLAAAALLVGAVYAGSYVLVNRQLGAQGTDQLRNVLSGILYGQGREVFAYVAVDLAALALLAHALLRGRGTHWLAWRPLAWAGRVSYGGYLFHALVLWLIAHALDLRWKEQPLPARIGLFVVAWGATVALASASFRWFETPLSRWGRSVRRRAAPAVEDARCA